MSDALVQSTAASVLGRLGEEAAHRDIRGSPGTMRSMGYDIGKQTVKVLTEGLPALDEPQPNQTVPHGVPDARHRLPNESS